MNEKDERKEERKKEKDRKTERKNQRMKKWKKKRSKERRKERKKERKTKIKCCLILRDRFHQIVVTIDPEAFAWCHPHPSKKDQRDPKHLLKKISKNSLKKSKQAMIPLLGMADVKVGKLRKCMSK